MALTEVKLTNQAIQKMANHQPVKLTLTFEGNGAGVAYLLPDWTILIVFSTAAQNSKYVNVSTPIAFRVLGMKLIHGNADGCSVQCLNTGDAVTDDVTVAANDKDIDNATEIDDAYWDFAEDDDDLRFEITTAGFLGAISLEIAPIIS